MNSVQITELFKKKGLRATPQRIAVYRYLLEHRTHPTAEEIYRKLVREYPSFSMTTVYNSLNVLEEAGLAMIVSIGGGSQLCYDGCTDFHGHFKCAACGKITDFGVSELQVKGLDGYTVRQKDVYFSGLCPQCKDAK